MRFGQIPIKQWTSSSISMKHILIPKNVVAMAITLFITTPIDYGSFEIIDYQLEIISI